MRMNDKPQLLHSMCVPTNAAVTANVQAFRGGTCAIWLRGWRPQYGAQLMITLRGRSRGRHRPAAHLLYILLDCGLAAPCVLIHTSMPWDKECLMFFF